AVARRLPERQRRCRRLLADHDRALHVHPLEGLTHRFAGGQPDALAIQIAHPAPRRERRRLGGADELEPEVRLHCSRRGDTARGRRRDVRPHAGWEVLSVETAGLAAAPSTGGAPAFSAAAPTKSRKSGCGRLGRERNSGWNCEATNQGWSRRSTISTSRSFGEVPENTMPASHIASR